MKQHGPFDVIYDTVTSPDDTDYSSLLAPQLSANGTLVAINGGAGDWARALLGSLLGCALHVRARQHWRQQRGTRPQMACFAPFSTPKAIPRCPLNQGRWAGPHGSNIVEHSRTCGRPLNQGRWQGARIERVALLDEPSTWSASLLLLERCSPAALQRCMPGGMSSVLRRNANLSTPA